MRIIYEDADVCVVFKEANELSQGNEKQLGLVEELSAHYGKSVHLIHRLDYGVSGLLVYALNQKSAAVLSNSVTSSDFQKIYTAICVGELKEQDHFEDLLYKDRDKAFVVKKERSGVKKASLDYRLLERKDDLNLVEIELHTGRYHQIRVQFASRKHPLVGDGKYGSKINAKRIALCANKLSFIHPTTKEKVSFQFDVMEEDIFKKYFGN